MPTDALLAELDRKAQTTRGVLERVPAAILLRIASLVAFLQAAAHGFLVVTTRPKHGAEEVALVDAMKSHHFDFLGWSRTYWGFYFGYGLMVAFVCLVEAVLFWQLSRLAKRGSPGVRPIAGLFALANAGFALIIWRYFFFVPLVPDLAIAVCLGLVALGRPCCARGALALGSAAGG